MLKRYTFIVVPNDKRSSRRFSLPASIVRMWFAFTIFGCLGLGYVTIDYINLRNQRENFKQVLQENKTIKGEARILMAHLDEVKGSLKKVKEYTSKLGEIANFQATTVTKKTGINLGKQLSVVDQLTNSVVDGSPVIQTRIPAGVEFDNLVFRPVFQRLNSITLSTTDSAFDLQKMISSLSHQKTLLSSIPSIVPVDGWITSGFGFRKSPFTGESVYHRGMDVAAPVGAPIHAPADGVVVFSGRKDGFGNFVMIAHGYGVVTGYGHNAQNFVTSGQVVKRGEQVAAVGQTGRTTGPHVHYEIWVNGKPVDPKRFIMNSQDVRFDLVAH
jgi:murein DD-endopeptidase MepM/ murein hydrolase activator NlpD